jgi:GT2 family glycosyltransferase
MKILCHVHTLNDEDVIDAAIQSIQAQRRRVDGIVLVDNASTDGTLARSFPPELTVIRHAINTGTCGSVHTGFGFAIEHGYDWIWVLDADSRPDPDALEKLVELYEQLPPEQQKQVGSIASRIIRGPTEQPDDYGLLTPAGPRPAPIATGTRYYECDSGIWSGTLFRIEAVKAIAPPRYGPRGPWDDFALDWGDIEYFWRLREAGFRCLVHLDSFIRHALGWQRTLQLPGRLVISTNHSAFRRYLYFRNGVYFWRYLYPHARPIAVTRYLLLHIGSQIVKITALEDQRSRKIHAILRGALDGLRGRIDEPAFTGP